MGRGSAHPLARWLLAAALLALLAALFVPRAAAAALTTHDHTGDVRGGKGLTKRERRALDIVSVTAIPTPAGAVAEVDLRGNFARTFGRGHLKRGVIALEFAGTGGKATVVTERLVHGRAVHRRSGSRGSAEVAGGGNAMFFAVAGLDGFALRTAKVETARSPLRPGGSVQRVRASGNATPADTASVRFPRPDCDRARAELQRLQEAIAREQKILAQVTEEDNPYGSALDGDLRDFQQEAGYQEQWIRTHCEGGGGTTTGGGDGGSGGTSGGGGTTTGPFACSATTSKNVTYTNPDNPADPDNGSSWSTATTGSCTGAFDTFEVRILNLPAGVGISEWIAKTTSNCTAIDDQGTEYTGTPTPPTGHYVVAIRCTRKPTVDDFYAYFRYTNGTAPPSGTHIQVTLVKDGVAQPPIDTTVP